MRRFGLTLVCLTMAMFAGVPECAMAQSWGQFKQEALNAESNKDYSTAADFWNKALDGCEPGGPRGRQSLAGLARCLSELGRTDQANGMYNKMLESIPAGSKLDAESVSAINEYVLFLRKLGRQNDADEAIKKYGLSAQQIGDLRANPASGAAPSLSNAPATPASTAASSAAADATASQEQIAQFRSLVRLSDDQLGQKKFAAAEKSLKDALAIADGKNDKEAALLVLAKLISACSAQSKFDACDVYANRMSALIKVTRGPNSMDYAQALAARAAWLRRLNRKQEAMAEESKAEAIMVRADDTPAGGANSTSSRANGVDTSGTKHGSIHSRARSAQTGYTDRINNLLEQK